jgi:hypothetical protein
MYTHHAVPSEVPPRGTTPPRAPIPSTPIAPAPWQPLHLNPRSEFLCSFVIFCGNPFHPRESASIRGSLPISFSSFALFCGNSISSAHYIPRSTFPKINSFTQNPARTESTVERQQHPAESKPSPVEFCRGSTEFCRVPAESNRVQLDSISSFSMQRPTPNVNKETCVFAPNRIQ